MKDIPPAENLWRARGLIVIGTLLYFFINVQRVAIPGSIFNELQSQLQVGAPAITGLGSAFMYIYAITQLFIGMLVDRYGGNRIIPFGALLFCVGSLMFPLAHTLPMLYVARVLTGLGAGSLYLCLIKETMRAFKDNYAVVVSVVIMIGFLGGIMANAPFVAISERVAGGFRSVLLGVGLATLFVYLLFVGLSTTVRQPPIRREIPVDIRRFGLVLGSKQNLFVYAFSSINFGMYYALQTVIGKKFLQDYCSMGSQQAAIVLSSMGAIAAVSGFAFALMSKALGNRRRPFCRFAGVVNLLVFLSLATLTCLDIRLKAVAVLLCLLSLGGSMASIVIPVLNETNPESRTGLSISFMNFCFYLCVAVFGNLVGYLMSIVPPKAVAGTLVYGQQSYFAVFSVLFVFSLIVFICSMKIPETYGRKFEERIEAENDRATAPHG